MYRPPSKPPALVVLIGLLLVVAALSVYAAVVSGFLRNGYSFFEAVGLSAGIAVLLVIAFALSAHFHK